jgi:hypothetical protein
LFIFHNFLDAATCEIYRKRISNHYQERVAQGKNPMSFDDSRTIDITTDIIGSKVQEFLESELRVRLNCHQVELQTWPPGCPAALHMHIDKPYGQDYNSLIYLNSNFEGGEFHTDTGITLRPTVGTLTFFNGREVMHGIKPVFANNRYTIIFWWKQTEFY